MRERSIEHTTLNLAAYHDGGQQDGQFYDSDFGGPMYVDGDEGLVLPHLSHAGHQEAKANAREIFGRTR